MDAITLEEIKVIIGGLWLENKLQANRIRALEAEVARLRIEAEADGGEIKEPPG